MSHISASPSQITPICSFPSISSHFKRFIGCRDTGRHRNQLCPNGQLVHVMIIVLFSLEIQNLQHQPCCVSRVFSLTQKWALSLISDWSAVSQWSRRPFTGFIRRDKRLLSSLSLSFFLIVKFCLTARGTSFIIRSRTVHLILRSSL